MNNLFIDDRAIEFIKKELAGYKVPAMRIFTGGGGCCGRFEIAPVNKALPGDATFMKDGIRIYIEKEIADNTGELTIRLEEDKGLLIEFG